MREYLQALLSQNACAWFNQSGCMTYLLVGQARIGKYELASFLTKKHFCLSDNAEKPCNCCASCLQFESNTHPDIKRLGSTGTLKIEDIRQLNTWAYKSSHYHQGKRVLIGNIERATRQASNALLKILEEPPKGLSFWLTSASLQKLLPTIVSRASVYQLQPLQTSFSLDWLGRAGLTMKTEDQALLLEIAGGMPLLALDFAKQHQMLDFVRDWIDALGRFLFKHSPDLLTNFVDDSRTILMLPWLMGWLVKEKLGLNESASMPEGLHAKLSYIAKHLQIPLFWTFYDDIQSFFEDQAMGMNPDARIYFSHWLMKWLCQDQWKEIAS